MVFGKQAKCVPSYGCSDAPLRCLLRTLLRPLLCSPGQLAISISRSGLPVLLPLLSLGPALGQPSTLADSSVPGPSATAVTATDKLKPPPPLVPPGAAALLGGPEPLWIGGQEGAAPVPLAVPPTAPLVPLGVPISPATPPGPPPVQPGRGLGPGEHTPGVAPAGAQSPETPAPGSRPLAKPGVEAPPPTTLVLDRSRRLLTVFENGRPMRRFAVAVGMPGWETPVGSFRVIEKTINPVWEHPQKGTHTPSGPANPLGSRWIGFHQDCQGRRGWDGEQMLDVKGCVVTGFHGTPHRWTVGRALSHGCVRLHDEDVRELFDLVSLGTPVTVLP